MGTRRRQATTGPSLPVPRAELPAPAGVHVDLTGPVATVVVDLPDWLDLATAPAVSGALRSALDRRPPRLRLDLSRCELVDAFGLRVLERAGRVAAAQGTELVLVGVNRRVRRVLHLTGLDRELTLEEPPTP